MFFFRPIALDADRICGILYVEYARGGAHLGTPREISRAGRASGQPVFVSGIPVVQLGGTRP